MKYRIPDNAKITSINDEFTSEKYRYKNLEGLYITTDKGGITLLIDNQSQCCESYGSGFLETPDDISKYIGATIISIEDTNDSELNPDNKESIETQLKIVTNRGILQYAVYNSYNSYYTHAVFLQVFDLVENNVL